MQSDSKKSGGLFNRVKGILRSHGQDALLSDFSDSGALAHAAQTTQGQKHHDDAVRSQEFAQLRKLHSSQASDEFGQTTQTSASSQALDDRALETLKKIDAIEAQISGQWQGCSVAAKQCASNEPAALHLTLPQSVPLSQVPVLHQESILSPVVLAQPEAEMPALAVPTNDLLQQQIALNAIVTPKGRDEFAFYPDLEDAAILFAHGDMSGSSARLQEQLQQAREASDVHEDKVLALWHAVFDVCRAIVDESVFELLAIDYANSFGRSAPTWYSMPERIGMPAADTAVEVTSKRHFQWMCPALLTSRSVANMLAAQDGAPEPWSMSWRRLESIEDEALAPLAQCFEAWVNSTRNFEFSGGDSLLQVLAHKTVMGDAAASAQWWMLRMTALRLMGRSDAYEQVALDYCVTYEVSPPAWEVSRATCTEQEVVDASTAEVSQEADAPTVAANPMDAYLGKGLLGVLEGDVQPWLDALTQRAKTGQTLNIACEHLIRLDFVAAGSLLNWAADMQSQGYTLRFVNLHRLVATFLHVMGIDAYAELHIAST